MTRAASFRKAPSHFHCARDRLSWPAACSPTARLPGRGDIETLPGAAGATYGLATHRSGVVVLRPTAGVGARLGSRVSVGGSVSMLWNRNELSAPYIFQTQAPLVGLKTMLDVKATGTGWSASLGAIVKPSRTVTAGVSWRSSTTLTTRGEASGDAWAQFAAAGIVADSAFEYSAAVRNSFPSMAAAAVTWDVTPRLQLAGQLERWGWRDAFSSLPITLTNGSNPAINGLVGSDRIEEEVPLAWSNQLVRRVGVEFDVASHGRAAWRLRLWPVACADQHADPDDRGDRRAHARLRRRPAARQDAARRRVSVVAGHERRVQDTALQGSEYDNTSVAVGVQGLVISVGRRF